MHRISKKQLLVDFIFIVAVLTFVVGIKNYTVKPLELKTMSSNLEENSNQELQLEEEFFWGVHMS